MGYQDAHIIDIRIFGRENPEGKINLRVNDRPFSIKKDQLHKIIRKLDGVPVPERIKTAARQVIVSNFR